MFKWKILKIGSIGYIDTQNPSSPGTIISGYATSHHLLSIQTPQSHAKLGPSIFVRVVIGLGESPQVLPEILVYGETYVWSVVRWNA